jgi:hypothetical protein
MSVLKLPLLDDQQQLCELVLPTTSCPSINIFVYFQLTYTRNVVMINLTIGMFLLFTFG